MSQLLHHRDSRIEESITLWGKPEQAVEGVSIIAGLEYGIVHSDI